MEEDMPLTMIADKHAFDRMTLRLSSEEQTNVISAIENKWIRLENAPLRDFAIVALALKSIRMTDNSAWESNGDAIVGIVRKGTLKTVMLRRFNQPMTKDALRVDVVKWAIKPPVQSSSRHGRNSNRNRNQNNRR
jgi:hypothetical protein|tara:strand:+ start:787 stop:1191 length:405 start_codon:yes stop_codon:yes gene_type:complete